MKKLTTSLLAIVPLFSHAGLQALDEDKLSQVSGQSGITIESDQHLTIDSASYSDNGNALQLKDIEIGHRDNISQAQNVVHTIDINSAGFLQVASDYQQGQINLSSLGFAADTNKTLGGFNLAFDSLTTVLELSSGGDDEQGLNGRYNIDLNNADFSWTTNNKSLVFAGVDFNLTMLASESDQFTLDVINKDNLAYLNFILEGARIEFDVNQILAGSDSYGQLHSRFDLRADIQLTGGGRINDQGIKYNADVAISNGSLGITNSQGSGLWFEGVSFNYKAQQGTIDVINSSDTHEFISGRNAVLISSESTQAFLHVSRAKIGSETAGVSFGGFDAEFITAGNLLAISSSTLATGCWFATGGETACNQAGGTWIDSQGSGIHLSLKTELLKGYEDNGTSFINRLDWIDADEGPNWTRWSFNDIYTTDGEGDLSSNDFGLRAELDVHMADTKVKQFDENNPGAAPTVTSKQGMALQSNLQFKELVVGSFDLLHNSGSIEQDHGVLMQNVNISANTTFTPIP